MKRMTRTNRTASATGTANAQLALIELPSAEPRKRRPRLTPAATVKYCNELLATLDRLAALREAQGEDLRVEQLAKLYEAAVESAPADGSRRLVG
jgi:hypothetical protein